eukprot:2741036-Pyramimonas_sp.AAC.1
MQGAPLHSGASLDRRLNPRAVRVCAAGVIEPSFGIGRIIYCLYEHSYYTRDGDEQRSVFKFTPVAAPVKCTVFPLLQKPEFEPYTHRVGEVLTRAGVARKVPAPPPVSACGAPRLAERLHIHVPRALEAWRR